MTVSIRQTLADNLFSGDAAPKPLSWDRTIRYIQEQLSGKTEADRKARHKRRNALYNDGGIEYINGLIDAVIMDKVSRQQRKAWAARTRFNNVTKRVVNEISTVYQKPAQRFVGGKGSTNQERFDALQSAVTREVFDRNFNRLLNLHRALLVAPRVKLVGRNDDGSPRNVPALDIITPAECSLLCHPNDAKTLVGVVVDIAAKPAFVGEHGVPRKTVWTEHEQFFLDDRWRMLGKPQEHGIGRLPYVFVSLDPATDCLWPGESGEDLTAAHLSIWFAAVCLLKETKSATKMALMSGDMASIARNQPMDTERVGEVPEGTTMQQFDMGMDLKQFINVHDHVFDAAGNNRGLSPAQLRNQGVQSAAARDLMRVPLREQRLEQHSVLRPFERELAHTMAAVMAVDAPEFTFDADPYRVNYADPQTPRSIKELLEEFEHARRLSVDSTIRFLMRQDPDLEFEDAVELQKDLVGEEVERNILLRPLQEISGSFGANLQVVPEQEPVEDSERSDDAAEEVA